MELNMEAGYASRWQELLAQLAPDRRRAMEFLRDHLPLSDLDCYPAELFLRFADHALALRETAAWCRELEEDIFNHYVLFPRVNDEDLSFHREIFRAGLWPRVKDLPGQEERALEVNRWCHEHACYQAQDERTASPLTVFRCGSGRCGEESAFLVSALRSVGIPARQVYAPRWSHCDDNHAWVEVLCGDVWRFLGACEPEPGLDRGWFITAASRAMLVHSRIFGQGTSPLHGEPLGREGAVCWLNQTPRYALTRMYAFRASADGKPAPGARFRLQVLNESSFHTIAVLTADSQGTARVRLGLGSLHVSADWKGLSAEADCEGEETVLCLTPPETADTPWLDFDFRAPAGGGPAPAVLSAAQKAERAETLRRGNALRAERAASLARPEDRRYGSLLREARGNAAVLRAFLNGSGASRRERLVRTLSEKDLRDVTLDILEDHFAHLPPCPGNLPEEIYWQYVACPRAALEPLTPWRGALSRRLSGWQGDPALLWSRLEALLERPRSNLYGNLYWTPVQALDAGRCDGKSLRVLLTAALRTMGIPARLRPLDGEPEIWRDGGFHPIRPQETGELRLSGTGQSWVLSHRQDGEWRRLHPEGGEDRLTLPAGRYRLVTSVRLPNGNQFAARRDFSLSPGEALHISLRQRPCRLEDLLDSRPLPCISAGTPDGEWIPDLFRQDGRPALAIWLEEGGEPSEHVLNELLLHRAALDALPVRLIFLLRSRESLEHPALAGRLSGWNRVQLLLDDWAYDLELLARHLACDPDSPPLAVACDGEGRAVYSLSGYRAGSVELLVRVAAHLCPGA